MQRPADMGLIDGRDGLREPTDVEIQQYIADRARGPVRIPVEQQISDAIGAAVPLSAFAEIIEELASTIPADRAPKLHAMKDRIGAIRAQVGR